MKYKEIKICWFCHIFSEPKHQANTMEREREIERERVLTCDRCEVPTNEATQNTEMERDEAMDRGGVTERRVFEVWRVRWEGSLKCGWVNEIERDCEVKSERVWMFESLRVFEWCKCFEWDGAIWVFEGPFGRCV